MENKYLSRKFLITSGTVILTAFLAYYSKMSPDVAIVFGAAIASYNYSNMREATNA